MELIEISDATKNDVCAIMEIENACFKHPWKESDILYELKDNPVSVLSVIKVNGHVVGYSDYWHTFDSATIAQIAVLPAYQRKHLASMLMNEILDDCNAKKVATITLEVRESNAKARAFYKKYNFQEIVIKPHYYSDGENAIYMTRRVNI